jgi:hypothetical protein
MRMPAVALVGYLDAHAAAFCPRFPELAVAEFPKAASEFPYDGGRDGVDVSHCERHKERPAHVLYHVLQLCRPNGRQLLRARGTPFPLASLCNDFACGACLAFEREWFVADAELVEQLCFVLFSESGA